MKPVIRPLLLAAALATTGLAQAAETPGGTGAYYGGAWFNGNGGITVGPYPTWAECNAALQQALEYHYHYWGSTVATLTPCFWRLPWAAHYEGEYEIRADTPLGSLDEASAELDRVRAIRRQFNADAYEAALHRLR